MEVSDVRKRIRMALEQAKQADAARRGRRDEAARIYDTFLERTATPMFRKVAICLKAEGYPFSVSTPAGSVRLASDGAADEFIELALDAAGDEPEVVGRVSRGRGRRLVQSERPIREGRSVSALTEEDVLEFLASEIAMLVRR